MKALVTGASGFIGSTLVEDLGNAGFDVYALLRKTSDVSNLKGAKFTRVEGDLSNIESLRRAVKGMDYVFHLAGAVMAPSRADFFRHNAEGTRLLAEAVAAERPSLKRFVHVSSLAAAGPALGVDSPRVEHEPNRPVSDYGASKLQGELEVLKFKDQFPVAIVRPPMVYGPKDKGVYVVIQTVARRLMPVMKGATPDGAKYYSSVHVRDLVRGITQVGLADADKVASGEVFYVNSDDVHTYEQLLEAMAGGLGIKPLRLPVPQAAIKAAAYGLNALSAVTRKSYPLNPDKLNEILPDFWISSSEKARTVVGFKPEFDLKTGMADAIRWYKTERWL